MTGRGTRLREAMADQGFGKQHAFAALLNVNESTVTRWLSDGPMSLDSAVEICRALDLSLDWLLLGRGDMRAHRAEATDLETYMRSSRAARLYMQLTPISRQLLDDFLQSMNIS